MSDSSSSSMVGGGPWPARGPGGGSFQNGGSFHGGGPFNSGGNRFNSGGSTEAWTLPPHLLAMFASGRVVPAAPRRVARRPGHLAVPLTAVSDVLAAALPFNNAEANEASGAPLELDVLADASAAQRARDERALRLRDRHRRIEETRSRILQTYDPASSVALKGVRSDPFRCIFVGNLVGP